MRHTLLIEYEYTREFRRLTGGDRACIYADLIVAGLYINSLALQAVVDRWTTMSHEAQQAQPGKNNNNNNNNGNAPLPGSGWFQTLMELYRVNEHYIQEVVDASRKILITVLDGLVPGDHLRHAPVRTYFRIFSALIFILKVRGFLQSPYFP